ncbi:MAG: hypothetical protein JWQ87_3702 [Candidatus Sulfotelmatobacter sp.]|nr:hypothetical protein [Candidatus Sulfotelmatobacter sp.]
MASPNNIVVDLRQAKELAEEMAALSKLQSEALQTAAYVRMSERQAGEYDHRRLRIGEACGLLGKFKPKAFQDES